jgi:hypothetical protein
MSAPATWQEAVAACADRQFQLAAWLLRRHIEREPAAAASALLVIFDAHEAGELGVDGVGFSRMDAEAGVRLGEALREAHCVERTRDIEIVKKLARRFSPQVMRTIGACAAVEPDVARANIRRLFAGFDVADGAPLELGDASTGGGAADEDDEDDEYEEDEDDLDGFVVRDDEDEGEEEEEDDAEVELGVRGGSGGDSGHGALEDSEEVWGAQPAHATPQRYTLASAAARDALAARADALRAACAGADSLAASLHAQLAAAQRDLQTAEARAAADGAMRTDEDEEAEDADADEQTLAVSAARSAVRSARRKRKLLFSTDDDDDDDVDRAPVLATPAPQRERSLSPLPPGLPPAWRRLRHATQ